ncbi:hypothetical protein KJ854_02010 [Patescibacteria group bacterium]|nr:hypothetical protein [Patescibacteria group bacterium]MBU4141693.1 hypothetical protein [Patescibacteria group bacterium]
MEVMEVIVIIAGFIIVFLFSFYFFSGEKERIKTLFRIYKINKIKFPEKSERELLEIVISEHIPPDEAIRLKSTNITGKKYIDEVFGLNCPDLDEIVCHIVRLEFSKKYNPLCPVDLEEIRNANRGKISSRLLMENELKLMIKKYHRKYLD